jgi:hypothetical protein
MARWKQTKDFSQARQPGKWLIHCHIGHHNTNNNVETHGRGRLTVVIDEAMR